MGVEKVWTKRMKGSLFCPKTRHTKKHMLYFTLNLLICNSLPGLIKMLPNWLVVYTKQTRKITDGQCAQKGLSFSGSEEKFQEVGEMKKNTLKRLKKRKIKQLERRIYLKKETGLTRNSIKKKNKYIRFI